MSSLQFFPESIVEAVDRKNFNSMMNTSMKPKDKWEPIVVTRGDVEVRIYRYYFPKGDRLAYCAQTCHRGKVYRRSRADLKRAITEAENLAERLSKDHRAAANTSLRDLAYYRQCERALNGVPLHVAVAFYHEHHTRPDKGASAHAVVKDYLDQLEEDPTLSKAHLDTRRTHLLRFADHFANKNMRKITSPMIDAYLKNPEREWERSTQANVRSSIVALFNFARRKGYVSRAYQTEAELSERINYSTEAPDIYTVDEVRRLLTPAPYQVVPIIALRAFAGLRSIETERLTWQHLDFERGVIRLTRDITKTNRERLIPLAANLQAWLKPYRSLKGNVFESLGLKKHTLGLMLRDAAGAAGIVLKENGFRHSFASYYLALTEDPGKTSLACGHSIEVLQSIYKSIMAAGEPITKFLAEQYFEIRPEK